MCHHVYLFITATLTLITSDQNVSVNDALKWFQKKAKQFGLDRSDNMYGTVSDFMHKSGKNDDGNLTVVEFFVNLKNFREVYEDFKDE